MIGLTHYYKIRLSLGSRSRQIYKLVDSFFTEQPCSEKNDWDITLSIRQQRLPYVSVEARTGN
ncbi:hypothetical protein ASF64_02110 [Arthrobacter sp. Leaf137]|nr:hypothetical protein ASF64_02110 [Arthrobacter sp. Leaf137]